MNFAAEFGLALDIDHAGTAASDPDPLAPTIRITGVAVMSGDDGMNLPVAAIGGTGGTSVLGNLVPADNAAMFRAVEQGDLAEARRLHHKYHRLVKALFMETSPLPVKTAMALMATGRGVGFRALVVHKDADGLP